MGRGILTEAKSWMLPPAQSCSTKEKQPVLPKPGIAGGTKGITGASP
jgi:hypothetical protein